MSRIEWTEAEFQALVTQLASRCGWWTMHVYPLQTKGGRHRTPTTCPGWPDLVLWHPTRQLVWFRELKTDGGRLSPDQRDCLRSLRAAGADVAVWTADQIDHIEHTLRATRPATKETDRNGM